MPDLEQIETDLDVKEPVDTSDAGTEDVNSGGDEGPQSMLEAVEAVLPDEGEPSDPANEDVEGEGDGEPEPKADADAQKDDGEDTSDKSEEKPPEGDPTDDEMENYSQKANARIRDLVSQRNEAQKVAEKFKPLDDFITKNDIPSQDLDVMLDLTAKLRHGDFAGFLKGIEPYTDLARQYTGQVLPPDLQQQVNQGYVSPEIAKELAQRRAQVEVGGQRLQQERDQASRQAAETAANAVRTTITQWEKETQRKDPDYALKADLIRRTSQALMQEHGNPRNAEQALQLVNAAYEEVNKQTANFRPAPKATSTSPRSTGQSGGSAPTAEPKSMMDAAMQALEARRA